MERFSNAMVTRPPRKNEDAISGVKSTLSISYAARVSEVITKARAGLTPYLEPDEFKFLVGQWTETLLGFVPEYRLNDCYLHAARTRDTSFPMTATDMCNAWRQIQEAERSTPSVGTYDWSRAREVCSECNGTGTVLFVKRREDLGRDYTYARYCNRC
jgi:hypothetical protein